jgi:two-component system phosphate regulon sensor histidine kinase PhoR
MNRLNRTPPADNRFEFARELEEHFQPATPLREGEIYSYTLPHAQVLYRAKQPGRSSLLQITGLSVNSNWIERTLTPALRRELNLPEAAEPQSNRELWIYGGTTAVVIAVLLLGVVLVIRDARREVRMSRLRADLVSGVSHELKTPLTLIRLYGETLLDGGDFPENERREFCGIIIRESERLSLLVQKVLSFSRIDRGEKIYSLQTGDLAAVIASVVEVYRKYLERAGFEVDARLIEQLPDVRFDADAVSQAVVNLLENAVKYSGQSKFIGIRLHAAAGSAVFEVEDRGIGIPPAERGRIFQRFYRSPNGSGKGGYGLGLFLVRQIMDAHLGRVEVESEPGAGSLFRLVFPVTA